MEVLFGISVLATSLLFMIKRGRRHGIGDAPLWFSLSSVIFVNIAFLTRAVETRGGTNNWSNDGLLVTSLGLLSFTVGATLYDALKGAQNRERPEADQLEIDSTSATRRLLVASAVVLLPAWAYFVLLGYVPLFEGLDAVATSGVDGLGALQASRLSRDGYASVNGVIIPGQGIMQLARNLGAPMVAAYALAQVNIMGATRTRVGVLVAASLTVLLAGQRWPLIYLGVALLASLSLSGGKIPFKRLRQIGLAVVLLGIGMSVMQRRTSETFTQWSDAIVFAIGDLLERIFFDQAYFPLLSYERGSYEAGELLGRSYLDSLLTYLPGPGESFPVEFYRTVSGSSIGYTAAPDFYTEAYINFNLAGVVVIPLLWGLLLAHFTRMRLSQDQPLNVGLKAGLTAVLSQSAFTGPVFTISGFIFAMLILASTTLLVRPVLPRQGSKVPRKTRVLR